MSPTVALRRSLALVVLGGSLVAGASLAGAQENAGKTYPLAIPPLEILERLEKSGLTRPQHLSEANRQFLTGIWAARSGQKTLPPADDAAVNAHLLASGIEDPAARNSYLKKFTLLVEAARSAVASARTDSEKADQLLHFLHKEVLKKGYSADETTLSAMFDTGKYNCVSSACLYYLVGTRLGLKLQPVLIPGTEYTAGHAAVDLLTSNRRIEIEPTNPDGFDFPEKLRRPGVVAIGPRPERKKAYDCDGFGLAGSIASNRGVAAAKGKPPRLVDALRVGLIALVLDPADDSAARNVLAAVSNWGFALDKDGKYAEALQVFEFGRAAMGKHKKLEDNYRAIWEHHLVELFRSAKFAEGLKELPRAAAAFPDVEEFTNAAEWIERAAQARVKVDGWAGGLAYADTALKEVAGKPAEAIRVWKSSARRHWSQDLLRKGDVDGSLKVIADGLAAEPDNKALQSGLAYHTREAIKFLDARKGARAAIEHYEAILKAFPKLAAVREVALSYADRSVRKLEDAKKFPEALKAAATYSPLAGSKAADLAAGVYDAWARSLVKDGKWEEAIKKYAEGLAAFPKNELLLGNGVITVDQWGVPAINKKMWAVAIERYELGIKHLGKHKELTERIEYCKKRMK